MMTNGGRLLKRGDTFDPEDARTTYRLEKARQALAAVGIRGEKVHGRGYEKVEFGWPKHGCDYTCKTAWPDWVTDEMFDAAYALADAAQTAAGDHNRAKAYAGR